MKLRNIIYSLSLLVGVLTLGSCVNDDDVCLPDGKTQVIFSLVLQDNVQGTTRAGDETWNNYTPKEDGVENDNYIDLDNLQVLVFDNSGAFKGTLADLSYTPKDITSDLYEYTEYEYVGTAPSGISAGTYKFVILANCPKQTVTDITELNSLTYNLFADSGNTQYIPMWGVREATLTLVAGARQKLEEKIGLLRAMAKVNLKLSQDVINEGYTIKDVTVTHYNKSGYTLPTGAATATATENLNLDASIHVNASAATNKQFEAADVTDFSFYLTEYDNWGEGATPAQLIVTLGKKEGETITYNTFTDYPIQFRDYVKDGDDKGTVDTNGTKYNIIRNHLYKFNIFHVTDDGPLYVKPTVADWKDVDPLSYKIDASTNMRLFDSWLYRYDTDGDLTADNYGNWATSHMLVSSNVDASSNPANRPLQSPQIQLVTSTTVTGASFELYVDNTDFEIVHAVKNEVGVVTGYEASTEGTLSIAAGEDVYTYFYIMPKAGVTPSNPVAKVFLYYIDPVLGKQEMPFNYGSLPGYSDDSSEIWVYYVAPDDYKYVEGSVLKMYYQDSKNPLVPTPVQN